jgi:hypothetical protein
MSAVSLTVPLLQSAALFRPNARPVADINQAAFSSPEENVWLSHLMCQKDVEMSREVFGY